MTIDGNEKVIALVKSQTRKVNSEIWLKRSTGELVPLVECSPSKLGTADGDSTSHIHLEGWVIPQNLIPSILEENGFKPWGTMSKGWKTLGHCYEQFRRLSYIYKRLKRGDWECTVLSVDYSILSTIGVVTLICWYMSAKVLWHITIFLYKLRRNLWLG